MLVLHDARIYPKAGAGHTASALAIFEGKIIGVCGEEVLREFEGRARFVDLHGRTVLPGLTDAHLHLKHYAQTLQMVDCETGSKEECLRRVAERVRNAKPGEWVRGHGWNQNRWTEGFGTAAELDAIASANPVLLTAKSLHASWANTAALQAAGINAQTPDPPQGKIGRDERGQPNGIVFEKAMEMLDHAVPTPTISELAGMLDEAQQNLWRLGITGVHDFDRRDVFLALQYLHQQGDLRLRVLKSIPLDDLPYAAALGISSGFGDDFLRIGGVKLFSDGALGPHTAAMLQPYEDDPENRGMLLIDAEEMVEHGRVALSTGISMTVHAIGDRANHEVLDAYERLRKIESEMRPGAPKLRHRIEHVQLIHPEDAHRLVELDIIASMQPIHAPSDMKMADAFWGERAAFSYAWRTQLDHGARLAFGSDAPVEDPNPFLGLHAAVTRRRATGEPGEDGWYPEQRLTLEEALAGFTTGAAYAAGMEDRLGQLSPGYLADLIVLEEDLFALPPDEIKDVLPVATMVGGEWVWGEEWVVNS